MRWTIPLVFLIGCSTPTGKLPADTGSNRDTASEEPTGDPGPGDDCEGGGILDCSNECWVADARGYIGDGTCDTGQRGPDFSCAEVEYDDGDCEPGAETTGTDDGSGATGGGDTTGEATGGEATAGTGTTDDATTGGGADATDGAGDATTGGTTDMGETAGGDTDASATTGGDTDAGAGSGSGATDAGATSGGSSGGGTTGTGISEYECDVASPGGPAPGAYDCRGECVALFYHEFSSYEFPAGLWMNGNCDDAGPGEYADFNCPEFAYDYGDCEGPF